ncbi:MAG: DUF3617 family protein [Betaproteobacteria bacterium]|nr:MAG: DUF3617 family protein [Betaproteobacteria bacterium]
MQQLLRLTTMLILLTAPALSAAGDGARKSGEWEIAVTVKGQSTFTSKVCIDSASDDIAAAAGGGAAQSGCEESSTETGAQGITIRSVCKQGNSTVTSTGTLSGDLETAYQGVVVKNYSPPLYGRTEVESTVEGRYLGGCS